MIETNEKTKHENNDNGNNDNENNDNGNNDNENNDNGNNDNENNVSINGIDGIDVSEQVGSLSDLSSSTTSTSTSTNINLQNEIPNEKQTEKISLFDAKEIHDNNPSNNKVLQGGGDDKKLPIEIIYTIDYIVDDDEKLVNPEKIFKHVDKYINNYYCNEIMNYTNTFNQIYQKYSNKNYIISNVKHKDRKDKQNNIISSCYKLIVKKNDKTSKIIKELIKPNYIFYNKNSFLQKLKLQISNERTKLMYKYETLTSKLNITHDEKQSFEKERTEFIDLLEKYYIYTTYHKKINKITIINKTNILLQHTILYYKENNDILQTCLGSSIYNIDKTIIDTMNKINTTKLTEYNNIIQTLSGQNKIKINLKDEIKNKEIIKSYIDNKEKNKNNEILQLNRKQQDDYIDYIIDKLPSENS